MWGPKGAMAPAGSKKKARINSKNKNKLGLKKHCTQRRTAFAVLAFAWTGGWKLGRLERRSPELASPPLVPHATVVQTKEETQKKKKKTEM